MLPKYDIQKLENAMYDFNKATDISITLFDTDGNAVTQKGTTSSGYCSLIASVKEGRRSCSRSNQKLMDECRKTKKIARHVCGAGLLDIAIPLLHRNETVGFLMIGQIKCDEKFPAAAHSFPIDKNELSKRYSIVPLLNEEKIASIINIATMLTKHIMFENMVKSQMNHSATLLADYIEEHISESLSVDSICQKMHMSASGIYKCIRQSYGCTLGEYISEKRIERAATLLEDTDLSVEAISESVGFSDSAYFSRCFKKARGISPLKYRKQQRDS